MWESKICSLLTKFNHNYDHNCLLVGNFIINMRYSSKMESNRFRACDSGIVINRIFNYYRNQNRNRFCLTFSPLESESESVPEISSGIGIDYAGIESITSHKSHTSTYTLADPAADFRGGGELWRRGSYQGTPKTKNSTDLVHYFLGLAKIHFRKNNFTKFSKTS